MKKAPLAAASSSAADAALTNSPPFDIIRSETALRYPVHSLSTGEHVRIEIRRKDDRGASTFLWEVTHNSKHGAPGHLAYKVDTLIVNRRIDEAVRGGKPVPKFLRLGSLSEIAREVGSGEKNTRAVKNALYQNAFAALTVKGLHYRASDKSERTFEFGDTRYGVIFTGERLPSGHRADAVYVVFHDLYLSLLNSAERRPLDYDYLRDLPPTAQRFYEIVSYEMLPAVRFRQRAKLAYSKFCLYSTMTRYTEFERVKKQMYKIHRPHIEKGYIARVEYEPTVDEDGLPDWNMFYTPGERAKYQQLVFSFDVPDAAKPRQQQRRGQQQPREGAAAPDAAATAPSQLPPSRSSSAPLPAPDPAADAAPPDLALPPPPETSAAAPEPSRALQEIAQELIAYFHQAFGRPSTHVSRSDPDVRVAEEFLASEGEERARYLVEFAAREAPKTKYRPRTFRGILQYRGEALAQWIVDDEARQRKEDAAAREIARRNAQEARRRAEAEQFEQTLHELQTETPEAYQAFISFVETKRRADVEWKRRQGMPELLLEKLAAGYDALERRRELYAEWVAEYEVEQPPSSSSVDSEAPAEVAAAIAASLGQGATPGNPEPEDIS